jgi:ribonuclease Z
MTNNESMSLPMPVFAGGTKAITMTPVVGKPLREYAEVFIPGEEPIEDGEIRVTMLGSGNPWPIRARRQPASSSKSATPSATFWFSTSGQAHLRTMPA